MSELTNAVETGNAEAVRSQLKAGVDVAEKSITQDNIARLPIHLAASRRDAKVAAVLLEFGADCNAKTSYGDTPLHLAISSLPLDPTNPEFVERTLGIIHLLIKSGADVNATSVRINNGRGCTPLHDAVEYGMTSLAQILIEAGADVNAMSGAGDTPLHKAVRRGHLEAVRLLLNRGANPNAKMPGYGTPLFEAIRFDGLDLVRILIDAGADPHAKHEFHNKTSLQRAEEGNLRTGLFGKILQILHAPKVR